MPSNIVLVHGAFHGGWCWRDVASRLRAAGHTVFAPTLTGLGERAHLLRPEVTLDTHVDDIVNLVNCEELDEVVLVAHSYGGMPTAGAADRLVAETPGRVSALVMLDSYIPKDGESALSVRDPIPPGGTDVLRVGGETINGADVLPIPPAGAFGLCGDLADWATRHLTPQPRAVIDTPVHLTGAWLDIPRKTSVRLSKFAGAHFDRFYDSAAADDGWTALRFDEEHNLMMIDPDWCVDVLNEHALA